MSFGGDFQVEDVDVVTLNSASSEQIGRSGWVNIGVHAVQLELGIDGNLKVSVCARGNEMAPLAEMSVTRFQSVAQGGSDPDSWNGEVELSLDLPESLQAVADLAHAQRAAGLAKQNASDPVHAFDAFRAYELGWYASNFAKSDFLELQGVLEGFDSAAAAGQDRDGHAAQARVIDEIMDASPWCLHPDYGLVERDAVEELDRSAEHGRGDKG